MLNSGHTSFRAVKDPMFLCVIRLQIYFELPRGTVSLTSPDKDNA